MKLTELLFSGNWGLEREALRVDQQGQLSTLPHPFPPEEQQITVDFAEAQPELITGVHASPDDALEELAHLQDRLLGAMDGQLLWPFSLPAVWPGDEAVAIARFADDPRWEDQRQYRAGLARTYGKARQLLSGIHVNYSFGAEHPGGDYLGLIRNFLRFRPVLTFLFGASPWLDRSFEDALWQSSSRRDAEQSRDLRDHTLSVRQGPLGYGNDVDLESRMDVRFDSLDEYLDKLGRALRASDGRPAVLRQEREFYAPARPKPLQAKKGGTLDALRAHGVGYLEFRIFDLDPFAPLGITDDAMKLVQLLVIACTVLPSPRLTPEERRQLSLENQSIAWHGLARDAHRLPVLRRLDQHLFPLLEKLAELGSEEHRRVVALYRQQLRGEVPRPIDRLKAWWDNRVTTPLEWGIERAQLHRDWSLLELSTRVLTREADARGARVKLLDPADNFLALEWGGQTEYVKQATRTSKDPYITALIMENKLVCKALLARAGMQVPSGESFLSTEEALAARSRFAGSKVVIKPNLTNFGEGVTMLEADAPEDEWRSALQLGFSLDRRVLVEHYVPGLEFRFLVIGGKTRAILHRVPANVSGDGVHAVRDLVALKNRHPWRGQGYRKPLERIELGDVELGFLAAQGLTPDSILENGRTVYLRRNSNISTGGDSIDFTDVMPVVYRRRAEAAAAVVGARICGLDLIIPDWQDGSPDAEATILELNFNPALHIHDFPAQGSNRRVERYVLDVLGLTDEAVTGVAWALDAACCG